MQELPLNGFYAGEGKKLTDRRCINWIPTPNDAGSLAPMSLMPTAGLGEGSVISGVTYNSLTYTKVAGQVFNYAAASSASSLCFCTEGEIYFTNGFGSTISYPLPERYRFSRMASSPTNLVVTGGGVSPSSDTGLYFTTDTGVAPTEIDYEAIFTGLVTPSAIDVAFIGGRFLYCIVGNGFSGAIHYSGIGGVLPNNLDFFAPDSSASRLRGLEVLDDRLYVFTEAETFIYQVTASVDTPFRQVGSLGIGIRYANEKTVLGKKLFIRGNIKGGGNGFYMISGGGYQSISTDTIDYFVHNNGGNRPSSVFNYASVFSLSEDGKDYVVFRDGGYSIASGDDIGGYCLVYSVSTGLWHERQELSGRPWLVIGAAASSVSGDNIVVGIDITEGVGGSAILNASIPSSSTGTEFGKLVERTMISAPFNDKNQRMMVDEIQPQCEVDYSVPIDGWAEPKINISMSHDFGNTFEQERGLNIGRAGNYTQETRFMSMGYVRQAFTLKLRSLNPYPTRVIALLSRLTKGGA